MISILFHLFRQCKIIQKMHFSKVFFEMYINGSKPILEVGFELNNPITTKRERKT